MKSFGNLSEKENAGSGSGFHLNDDSRFDELHFFSFFPFFIPKKKKKKIPSDIFPYDFSQNTRLFNISISLGWWLFNLFNFFIYLKGKNETLVNVPHALISEKFKAFFA